MYSYTKNQVLQHLRIKIIKREDRKNIAQWAYKKFLERIKDMNPEFEQLLIDLSCMQDQIISYEQLEDRLDNFYMGDDFLYDRLEFAKDLRRQVQKRVDTYFIAQWAGGFHFELDHDLMLSDVADRLAIMCCDECFDYSYEELNKIVDQLIAGEDVTL